MTILVRFIFHKAVTPTCDVLCLGQKDWRKFLFASPQERLKMVMNKLNKTFLLGTVREMTWIPYDNQDVFVINNEVCKKT